MINLITIIILSIVQGIAEFLPISSSGHLSVLYAIFNIEDNVLLLTILLHIATLVSILIYYRKEIYILITHPLCPTNRKIIVTLIVSIITRPIAELFFNIEYLVIGFSITAIILLISDYLSNTRLNMSNIINIYNTIPNIDISYKQSILIGLSQGIAIIPGISRSGSTISTALMLGVDKSNASMYSFLISIPIIIGSGIVESYTQLSSGNISIDLLPILIGCVLCTIVGYISIKYISKLVNSSKLHYFAYYLIALASIILVATILI